jgi:hypothetical protein
VRDRAVTLSLSALLHAAALGLLLLRAASGTAIEAPAIVVESVTAAALAPPDQRLTSPDTDPADGSDQTSPLELDVLTVDLTKIRARENVLFPFLTLDLMFLDRVSQDRRDALRRLSNPLTSAARRGDAPPLEISNAALQQLVDRAWSRRERWKTFAEVAALVASHHPSDGRAPEVIRQYLDQNILQPYCDGRRHDLRFWAMLENAADHADFVDFVRSYARQHPSSKTTTELLFLLDELAQGSRDVILMLMETRPDRDLDFTRTVAPEAFRLSSAIKDRYGRWLFDRGMDKVSLRGHYDELRLRLLQTIIETTPEGYRAADAQYLAAEVLFGMGRVVDAERLWRSLSPVSGDAYYRAYSEIRDALASGASDVRTIRRILENEYGRWRLFSIDRLRQFGHRCDTF